MLKDGRYCIYRGKEYHIEGTGRLNDNNANIYTKNKDLVDYTFRFSHTGYYEKEIQYGEVDEAYDIQPYAAFGNMMEPIQSEEDDRYIIRTYEVKDEEVIEKYHLKWVDRGEMVGWISKDQVEVKYLRWDIDYFGDWKKKLGRELEGYGKAYEITLDDE